MRKRSRPNGSNPVSPHIGGGRVPAARTAQGSRADTAVGNDCSDAPAISAHGDGVAAVHTCNPLEFLFFELALDLLGKRRKHPP